MRKDLNSPDSCLTLMSLDPYQYDLEMHEPFRHIIAATSIENGIKMYSSRRPSDRMIPFEHLMHDEYEVHVSEPRTVLIHSKLAKDIEKGHPLIFLIKEHRRDDESLSSDGTQ